MTTITLDRLTKRFPRQPEPTLRGISLEVAPGQMLALLGPSGSGKSTILKLIAGIETPDSGDIRFDGQSILGVAANRRGAVLMFQKAYLFPFMTVLDNIGFGLKVQGTRRQTIRAEVARMLDLVGLPGIERKYPDQLSGGEQQRVALARALITNPRMLLLDEPLSSLDTNVRQTLQEATRRIQRELSITTLLVTHDLSEAVAMADQVALLLDGTIEACAPPEELFQRPPTRKAARFVGVSAMLAGEIAGDRFCMPQGQLTLAPGTAAQPAGRRHATLAIRPERLNLLAAPAHNTLPGCVVERIYKGEYTEYQVRLGDSPHDEPHSNHTSHTSHTSHNGHKAPATADAPDNHDDHDDHDDHDERDDLVRVRVYLKGQHFTRGDTVHVQFPAAWLFELERPTAQPAPPAAAAAVGESRARA